MGPMVFLLLLLALGQDAKTEVEIFFTANIRADMREALRYCQTKEGASVLLYQQLGRLGNLSAEMTRRRWTTVWVAGNISSAGGDTSLRSRTPGLPSDGKEIDQCHVLKRESATVKLRSAACHKRHHFLCYKNESQYSSLTGALHSGDNNLSLDGKDRLWDTWHFIPMVVGFIGVLLLILLVGAVIVHHSKEIQCTLVKPRNKCQNEGFTGTNLQVIIFSEAQKKPDHEATSSFLVKVYFLSEDDTKGSHLQELINKEKTTPLGTGTINIENPETVDEISEIEMELQYPIVPSTSADIQTVKISRPVFAILESLTRLPVQRDAAEFYVEGGSSGETVSCILTITPNTSTQEYDPLLGKNRKTTLSFTLYHEKSILSNSLNVMASPELSNPKEPASDEIPWERACYVGKAGVTISHADSKVVFNIPKSAIDDNKMISFKCQSITDFEAFTDLLELGQVFVAPIVQTSFPVILKKVLKITVPVFNMKLSNTLGKESLVIKQGTVEKNKSLVSHLMSVEMEEKVRKRIDSDKDITHNGEQKSDVGETSWRASQDGIKISMKKSGIIFSITKVEEPILQTVLFAKRILETGLTEDGISDGLTRIRLNLYVYCKHTVSSDFVDRLSEKENCQLLPYSIVMRIPGKNPWQQDTSLVIHVQATEEWTVDEAETEKQKKKRLVKNLLQPVLVSQASPTASFTLAGPARAKLMDDTIDGVLSIKRVSQNETSADEWRRRFLISLSPREEIGRTGGTTDTV